MRDRAAQGSLLVAESFLDALILLPLALWQTVCAGCSLTTRDLLAGIILGVMCTALEPAP